MMQVRLATLRTYWLRTAVISALAFTLFAIILFASDSNGELGQRLSTITSTWPTFKSEPVDIISILQERWNASMHDIDNLSFTIESDEEDGNATTYEVNPELQRWSNLGKRVLIIDVDSRLDLEKGAMLSTRTPTKGNMKGRTAGIMNHFMYALVHGYDYRLIRAPQYEDRHGTWVKIPMMRKALEQHEFVIFLDADAIFEHIGLPFEWLMNRWNVTENTMLAIAKDPWVPNNSDAWGRVMWNTGFMLGQRSERTSDMFARWEDCPTGQRYDNCTRWAYDWAHEQAALANHVRYDYDDDEGAMRELFCNEANGMPGPRGGPNCNGVFVRHYWYGKDSTVQELYDRLPQQTVTDLHTYFHQHKEEFFLDASEHSYPLGDDVVI